MRSKYCRVGLHKNERETESFIRVQEGLYGAGVNINKDRIKKIQEEKRRCRSCKYFVYQIHHASYCELGWKKGVKELHDGRASACEQFKSKKRTK